MLREYQCKQTSRIFFWKSKWQILSRIFDRSCGLSARNSRRRKSKTPDPQWSDGVLGQRWNVDHQLPQQARHHRRPQLTTHIKQSHKSVQLCFTEFTEAVNETTLTDGISKHRLSQYSAHWIITFLLSFRFQYLMDMRFKIIQSRAIYTTSW